MIPDTALSRNVLPQGLTAYKRTPMFDQNNLPIGLRREHRTKAFLMFDTVRSAAQETC